MYENETARQSKIRINNLISIIQLENKDKMYSWSSIRDENKIIEINEPEKFGYNLSYCKECKSFTCHQYKGCMVCRSKKTGLGNPEIHQKTINSQIKNGTFNMMNEEIQKNKSSNSNLDNKIEDLFCKKCNKVTKHKIWKNGKKSCCICNAKNNGLKLQFCNKCKKLTMHNGSICTECNPNAAVQNNLHYEFCDVCNKETYHNGTICLKCNPEKDISKNNHNEFCSICNKITYHVGKFCTECNPEFKNIGYKNCKICNKLTFHIGKKCTICNPEILEKNGLHNDYCKICNSITAHNGTICLICNPESIPHGTISNFIYKDVLYYKSEPVYQIIEKLESGEYDISNFPGWNKKFCYNCNKEEYHYGTICLVCYNENFINNSNFEVINGVKCYKKEPVKDVSRKILSDSNFTLMENVKFILNHSTCQYEIFDNFCENLNKEKLKINPCKQIRNFINTEGFEIEMIINNGKNKWSRSQTDAILCEKGYGYFVYVKLLDGYLWIGGKTGTSAVSNSSVDFDFIIGTADNPNYAGPGREYARKYYPDLTYSDFKFVLCKRCNSEQEALDLEQYIVKKYNLFES